MSVRLTEENYYRSPKSGKGLCRVCQRERKAARNA